MKEVNRIKNYDVDYFQLTTFKVDFEGDNFFILWKEFFALGENIQLLFTIIIRTLLFNTLL